MLVFFLMEVRCTVWSALPSYPSPRIPILKLLDLRYGWREGGREREGGEREREGGRERERERFCSSLLQSGEDKFEFNCILMM